MVSLTFAFIAAFLALVGKIFFDLWERHHRQRVIAAALASEIGAYLKQLDPINAIRAYKQLAEFDHETRRRRLRSMPKPPAGHPVFDKVVDQIGLLPVAEVLGSSSFYNIISGLREFISHLSSDRMAGADDESQIAALNKIAEGIEQINLFAPNLVERLRRISDRGFWRSFCS